MREHPDTSERQERLDTYYHQRGPCCAGCDWWHSLNSRVGECHRTAMIPGADRSAPLGMTNVSLPIGAGHAMTPREHVCGEFQDGFDWSSLPMPYLKRIGAPDPSHPDARGGDQWVTPSAMSTTGARK